MTWESSEIVFGLAEPKREGAKLTPNQYLYLNGKYPPKDFYTKEEFEELERKGYSYKHD